ncbi:MAG: hypothetical protein PVS3B3_21550 [Ktedonobacteraceae bacterium]
MSTVPQKLGKYELQQPLGRGNVGEVWQGYDPQYKRDVAVKVIHTDLQSDPNFMKRFTTEGQKIVSLRHDNIVPVYDVAIAHQEQSTSTIAYIASAYIEGQTLGKYIARARKKGLLLSLPDIVYLFTSLGVAIDYAHQQGIIQGNIKPSNILLDQHHTGRFALGEPMLTDFGLPLLLGNAVSIGTPHYMSPEQARGNAPNNRSDIYALGVILYELCTGTKPFRDESSVAVMMQHMNTLPTPPILINAQLPPALSEVILRALAKDTATRYAIASLLATAIADACSIRSTISLPHVTVAEEESAYHVASGQYGSFLGVSQPIGPTKPMTQPIPRIDNGTPVPTMPAAMSSVPPVSNGSGKQRSITPTPTPITQKIPTPLPSSTLPTNTAPQLTRAAFITEKTTQPSMVTQAYAPIKSAQAFSNTSAPMATRSKYSRITDVPMYGVLAIFAIILLIATGIIGSVLLSSKGADSSSVVGHVFFQDDALGHADVLRLDIQNIASPAQNKTYQAWLQDSNHHTLPLGTLTLHNNNATLLYPGDAKHTNLLSLTQGVIVTNENAGQNPSAPTGDVAYIATLNTASFQYIKNILYQTPNFPVESSVIVGIFETIKSINDKAGSLVDSVQGTHDYALAKRQATRIIELIDGTQYAKISGDLPQSMQSEVYAKVGLLSSPTQQGYIDTLATQLDKLQQAAPNNTSLQQHIQNIKSAITDLRDWIQKLRIYDTPLVQATDIADPALFSNALQVRQFASDSYTGRTVPPNDGPRPILGSAGAYQAYIECQYLATLDIKKIA